MTTVVTSLHHRNASNVLARRTSLLPLIFTTLAGAMVIAGNANAAYTCMATVWTGPDASGLAPLGSKSVNNASECHEYARAAFAANANWFVPDNVCSRYPSAKQRTVHVLDYYKELGNSSGYNRVGGYTVYCNGAKGVVQLPTAPTVVPSQ